MDAATLRRVAGAGFLALAAASAACSAGASHPSPLLGDGNVVVASAANYDSVAWVADDLLVVSVWDEADHGSHLHKVAATGQDLGEFDGHPGPDDCYLRVMKGLTRLPDGRLGFKDACTDGVEDFAAADMTTGEVTVLGHPKGVTGPWAINPDGAIVYDAGVVICGTLYRLDAAGDLPVGIPVDVDGHRFDAGQDLVLTERSCPVGGHATLPAFSSDGSLLAFLAAGHDGVPGPEVLDRPYTLVVWDGSDARNIASGVRYPSTPSWVPGRDEIVLNGEIDRIQGLWRISRDGQTRLLATGEFLDVAWSPDGSRLIALITLNESESDRDHRLVMFSTEQLIQGAHTATSTP
jgi:WD40-like Beta Propeller Repeat